MNILHPTDFSETASHALDFARTLRKATNGTLHVAHVQERFELPDDMRIPKTDRLNPVLEDHLQKLREQDTTMRKEMLRNLAEGNDTSELIWGQPVRELLHVQKDYDLIVIGTDGYSRLDTFFLGSITSRLLRRAETPMVIVRDKPTQDPLKRIAVAVDFTPTGLAALEYAKQFNLPLTLIHVITHARDSEDSEYVQDVSTRLHDLADDANARIVLNRGNPIIRLPELAVDAGAGMLVMGLRHARQGLGLRLGARVDGIVRSAKLPVLTVPYTE